MIPALEREQQGRELEASLGCVVRPYKPEKEEEEEGSKTICIYKRKAM